MTLNQIKSRLRDFDKGIFTGWAIITSFSLGFIIGAMLL